VLLDYVANVGMIVVLLYVYNLDDTVNLKIKIKYWLNIEDLINQYLPTSPLRIGRIGLPPGGQARTTGTSVGDQRDHRDWRLSQVMGHRTRVSSLRKNPNKGNLMKNKGLRGRMTPEDAKSKGGNDEALPKTKEPRWEV